MNFLDLEYFIAIAETLSFTRAAAKLHISQQSLSAHILKLEQYYQTKLFYRTAPLTLTPAGGCLLKRVRTLMALKGRIDVEIQEIRLAGNNLLNIGILENRSTALMQSLLPKIREMYPDIRLKITEILDDNYSSALHNGMVDLMLGYRLDSELISFVPLVAEQYYLVVPKLILYNFFDKAQRKEILSASRLPISVFRGCPFLACSQTTWLKKVFEACCCENNIIPNTVVDTSSILTRLSLCISGFGIMFISSSLLSQCQELLDRSQLERLYVICVDYQPSQRYQTLGINYLAGKKLSPAVRSMIQLAQQKFPFTAEEP